MLSRLPKSRTKQDTRAAQIAWVQQLIDVTGKTPTALAVEAGLSDTTLTRFLNQKDYTGVLAAMTIAVLAEFHGHPAPGATATPGTPQPARTRNEAALYDIESDRKRSDTLRSILAGRADASVWQMQSDVLQLSGVREGDLIVIDSAEPAKAGDIICVQVEYDRSAKTVFRVLDAPFAIAASLPVGEIKPLLINGETVRIAGVMTDLLRSR
ncbi:MAG: hypothetical protein LCH61_19140 [Proteobacteria bacterium]|nr:hypothetical protein [Pseudomonadota bacterium]